MNDDKLNEGFINNKIMIGSYEKVISFLQIFTAYFDNNYSHVKGYGRMLLNIFKYLNVSSNDDTNLFDYFNPIITNCDQRMCSNSNEYFYNNYAIYMKNTTCSPVLIYKSD